MKRMILIVVYVVTAIGVTTGAFIGYQWHVYNRTIKLDSQCSVILDDAGNSILLFSEDGKKALLVDTKKGKEASALAKKINVANLTIINTHAHFDHTEGNTLYQNVPIFGGDVPLEVWNSESKGSRYPTDVLRPGEERIIDIGSEKVRIRNTGRGHTSNDLIVYFEKRHLLATGDLLFPSIHPVLFPTSGGNIPSWVQTLDSLIDDTTIHRVIPGHGLPANHNVLATQREYFTSIASTVNDSQKLSVLEKKYSGYYEVPGLSSFDKTVEFLIKERNL